MQLKTPRVWQPVALVSAGILAGVGATFFLSRHEPQTSDATMGGATKVASSEAMAVPRPQSIEIDGTRIPPPPQVIAPAPAEQPEHMQFAGSPSGQKLGEYDARTVEINGRQLEYGRTISGYPINVGRKAVDSQDPEHAASALSGADVTQDPGGWRTDGIANGPYIGSKGLVENPCVDPPSTHGASYSRGY